MPPKKKAASKPQNERVANQTAEDGNFVPVVDENNKSGNHESKLTAEGYGGKPKEFDQDFTYPTHTDPRRQIPGTNVYLDDVQRQKAEIQRAAVEDRDPDLDNAPAFQGTPLIPTHVIKTNSPGDAHIEPDVTLKVVAGVPEAEKEKASKEPLPVKVVN